MNRRTFLRSLLALPFAAKAALSARTRATLADKWDVKLVRPGEHLVFHNFNGPPARDPLAYGGSNGVLKMLYGNNHRAPDYYCSPEQKVELEKIFKKLYALKKSG